jgi:hypothetical protein
MNFLNKKMLLALAFLGFSGSAFGYVWTFTNLTDVPVVIELRLLAFGHNYYDIVKPGQNSVRFSWPLGSLKAGFCLDKFFIGELDKNVMGNMYQAALDNARTATETAEGRARIERIGKSEPSIKWISGEKWGTFDQATRDAVNTLSSSVTNIAGEAANVAVAAGAEAATGGATAGTAGTLAAKLNIGKIFDSISSIPGSIMTLAHKSPCASRHFDIIKSPAGAFMVVTKD